MTRVKVIGPPGTGKTTWMIGEIARLIEQGYDPSEIVATTFTRAGRRAIREKVFTILQSKGLVKGSLEAKWLGRTIHSICKELLALPGSAIVDEKKLKRFAEAYGLNLSIFNTQQALLEGEYRDLMLSTADDYCMAFAEWWRHRGYARPEDAYRDFTAYYKHGLPSDFVEWKVYRFLKWYDEWKQDNGYWDFTDMLLGVLREGLCPEGVRVLACDEAQDFSPLLMRVAKLWEKAVERSYFVGDHLQAIYGFAGGNPELLERMPSTETVFLEQSHRVPKAVWECDKELMVRFSRWYEKDYLPSDEMGAVLRGKWPNWEAVINEGLKVFVQHRTRMLAREFADAMIEWGIPFVALRGKQSPLQGKEAKLGALLGRLAKKEKVKLGELAEFVAETPLIPTAKYMAYGAKTRMRRMAEENPDAEVDVADLPGLGFNDAFMEELLEGDVWNLIRMEDRERFYLRRAYERYGSYLMDVRIYNGTIHSFKGEECDLAIVNPDLTLRTAEGLSAAPREEVLVWHVALTRAKKAVVILPPTRGTTFPL